MSIEDQIVDLASEAHRKYWSPGNNVSLGTKKSLETCREWQQSVKAKFGSRFKVEYGINGVEGERSHRIDLVDVNDRVAYELKASPFNVHMEIYRDIFKTLVFNERNLLTPLTTLVFIAPSSGIKTLNAPFLQNVKSISVKLGLTFKLRQLS